jgi:hypothetical protein
VQAFDRQYVVVIEDHSQVPNTVKHRQPSWWSNELRDIMDKAAGEVTKFGTRLRLTVVEGPTIAIDAPPSAPAWMVASDA